jgi:hypothetical protein
LILTSMMTNIINVKGHCWFIQPEGSACV